MSKYRVTEKSIEQVTRLYETEAECKAEALELVRSGAVGNYDADYQDNGQPAKYTVEYLGDGVDPETVGTPQEALLEVQRLLACFRDKAPYVHPVHGQLALEEFKYLVVDPVVEQLEKS